MIILTKTGSPLLFGINVGTEPQLNTNFSGMCQVISASRLTHMTLFFYRISLDMPRPKVKCYCRVLSGLFLVPITIFYVLEDAADNVLYYDRCICKA